MNEEMPTVESDASTTHASANSSIDRQRIANPSLCKVCEAPALYSYYGAVVCRCCKVFFKRNTHHSSKQNVCNYGGNCEVDINNRRICPACRLARCFKSGMRTDMIRASWTEQTKANRQKKTATNPTSTTLSRISESNRLQQIPTLNLLRADQSTLTFAQWNQISNIVHCFDEYSDLSYSHHFMDEQSTLPPKFRYKHTSVKLFFTSMMTKVQTVFEKNRDHLSLSLQDRITLLHSTIDYTTSFGVAFILGQTHLFDLPTFTESAELIFRPTAVSSMKRLIEQLSADHMFVKMSFAIIAFLASNYTVYTITPSANLTDAKAIVRIQDMYTELVWRYLLYKYNHREAVTRFSDFIRCLFLVNSSVVEAYDAQEFTDIIDSVVQSTEQKLLLDR